MLVNENLWRCGVCGLESRFKGGFVFAKENHDYPEGSDFCVICLMDIHHGVAKPVTQGCWRRVFPTVEASRSIGRSKSPHRKR
jgi:hypothetical protein